MNKKFILFIALIVLVVSSCQKKAPPATNTGNPGKNNASRPIDDSIGYYHNQALALTETYWNNIGDSYNVDTELNLAINTLGNAYPNFTLTTAQRAYIFDTINPYIVAYTDTINNPNADLTAFFRSFLLAKKNRGDISTTLYNDLYPITDTTLSYEQCDSILKAIDLTALSSNEQYCVAGMISIHEYSYTYWTNYMNNGGARLGHKTTQSKTFEGSNAKAALIDCVAGLFAIGATARWMAWGAGCIAAVCSAA